LAGGQVVDGDFVSLPVGAGEEDVAVNDGQPALIADGILTFGYALSVARSKIKESRIRGGSEGVFFEVEIGSVHSDSGGRVNHLDMTPESITAQWHTCCQDPKNHLLLALL
jgi:hypothetical protein